MSSPAISNAQRGHPALLKTCGLATLLLALVSCESLSSAGSSLSAEEREALELASVVDSNDSDVSGNGQQDGDSDEAESAQLQEIDPETADLLTMSFEEAKAISKKSLEIGESMNVACDRLEVSQTDAEGQPRMVRAIDKVFIEFFNDGKSLRALCQELLIDRREVVLRGRPIILMGESVLEGQEEDTLIYLIGKRIRVIGKHRLALLPGSSTGDRDLADELPAGTPPAAVKPTGPWSSGPDALLPPLSTNQVPAKIREELMKADLEDQQPKLKASPKLNPAQPKP